MSLRESADGAVTGARGAAVILSANPIHDTGGGQRSAQMALELLDRDRAVLFVSHGVVTETVDLGLVYPHPRLVQMPLEAAGSADGRAALRTFLTGGDTLVVTQVPVASWRPVLEEAARLGAVCVYDLIDRWDSELGYGWYRPRDERRIAGASHLLVASAPPLLRYLERRTGRRVHPLPNAFNHGLFRPDGAYPRPPELPRGPVVLYVGALWGGWMDWGLVDRVARAHPDVSFVFVGDHRGEGAGLPRNCRFPGLKPQADLPAYLAHARVGLLPWRADDVTQATSPLKVYEYLAMELPVVAPELEPLGGIPGVTRCGDEAAFVRAVGEAVVAAPSLELRASMASFARENSWARRVDRLLALASESRDAALPPTSPWSKVLRLLGA